MDFNTLCTNGKRNKYSPLSIQPHVEQWIQTGCYASSDAPTGKKREEETCFWGDELVQLKA